MTQVKKNINRITVSIPPKLIGADTIVPFIYSIKKIHGDIAMDFLFINRKNLDAIENNYVLYKTMLESGRVITLSMGRKGRIQKILTALRTFRFLLSLVFKRTLFLSCHDFGQFPFNLFARATRIGGGRRLVYSNKSYPYHQAEEHAFFLQTGDAVRKPMLDPGEARLIYHPKQLPHYPEAERGNAIIVGTPRGYKIWKNRIQGIFEDEGILDEKGKRIEIRGEKVIALFYSGDFKTYFLNHITSFGERFRLTLTAIREGYPNATILLKPHVISPRAELIENLAAYKDLNINITHAHPQLIAKAADVAVFASASNVMNDMYIEGVPVVDCSDYTEDIRELGGSIFPASTRVSANTKEEIIAALTSSLKKGKGEQPVDLEDFCHSENMTPFLQFLANA